MGVKAAEPGLETPEAMIRTDGLTKAYGNFVAVNGVDLSVSRGEIFGFLGPNGAGKSTTIKMLTTLLRPTGGRAAVAGKDVASDRDGVRRAIGIVFQDPTLDDRLTAVENLYLHGILYGMTRRESRERADAVLEMMELSDRAGDLVRAYSGGMKRRLEIARGLMHRPQVLFLDEPTVGLDPQTRKRIWEYIRALRDREGLTIFMTTHYMDEAEHCDRIAIMDRGRIISLDTPAALKSAMGRDVITLQTDDNEEAQRVLNERLGIEARPTREGVQFEVEGGEAYLPQLLSKNLFVVRSIQLHKPTLDDVFMHLTGRAIREEEVGSRDLMRQALRRRGL